MKATILAAIAASSLLPATVLAQTKIARGNYAETFQFTSVDDPSGACKQAGVYAGLIQAGSAKVLGLGKPLSTIIALPQASSPYGVFALTCSYTKLPTTLSNSGSTEYDPTVSCSSTATNLSYQISGGTGTINEVAADQFKITTSGYAIVYQGQTLCTISTDSLFTYSGAIP